MKSFESSNENNYQNSIRTSTQHLTNKSSQSYQEHLLQNANFHGVNIGEASEEDFIEEMDRIEISDVKDTLHKHCITVLNNEDLFDNDDIT